MKKRVLQFFKTYFLFVALFVVQKPLFMLYYHDLYKEASWADYWRVMWHGLPLDFSLAGYLTVIPGLLLIVSAWSDSGVLRAVQRIYFAVVSLLMSTLFVVDVALYGFWGFRLDVTPLFYLSTSFKDTFASVSMAFVLVGFLVLFLYAAILYGIFHALLIRSKKPLKIPYRRQNVSLVLLLLTAALFVPIRGGFTVSTINLSKVYFSADQRLNHAAINPIFSFIYSATHQHNFSEMYRFMPPEEADRLFAGMCDTARGDSIVPVLNTNRPDIVLVILESFSTHVMGTLGGQQGVAVHLDSLGKEGILFTNFYGNSFRTDRGLVSILSGYPGQPNTSIMKYPEKAENLPAIPRALKQAGYSTAYYYGGDADFTNMRSYLLSAGIDKVVCDEDFPLNQRFSKWGAPDHVLFQRFFDDLAKEPVEAPSLKIIQTSSSHEPFDVPFHRLDDKVLNAFAYADSCVGDFVERYRKLPRWKNTLLIFVPDHQGAYPKPIDNPIDAHTIPLILAGGAVKGPMTVDTYASQIDLAATLLSQLGLPHDEFVFSKDIFNPEAPHFAYFTEPDLFGMLTPENRLVYNLDADAVQIDEGAEKGANLERGKAFLQKLYDDLATR